MNSVGFVKAQLENMLVALPYLQVRYEYDTQNASHSVEVLPLYFYKEKSYIFIEQEICKKFVQMFPYETLVFVSEGSLYEVENPVFVAKGLLFDFRDLVLNFNFAESEIFRNYTPNLPDSKDLNMSFGNEPGSDDFVKFIQTFRHSKKLNSSENELIETDNNFWDKDPYSALAA
jgi:hypothetical protein